MNHDGSDNGNGNGDELAARLRRATEGIEGPGVTRSAIDARVADRARDSRQRRLLVGAAAALLLLGGGIAVAAATTGGDGTTQVAAGGPDAATTTEPPCSIGGPLDEVQLESLVSDHVVIDEGGIVLVVPAAAVRLSDLGLLDQHQLAQLEAGDRLRADELTAKQLFSLGYDDPDQRPSDRTDPWVASAACDAGRKGATTTYPSTTIQANDEATTSAVPQATTTTRVPETTTTEVVATTAEPGRPTELSAFIEGGPAWVVYVAAYRQGSAHPGEVAPTPELATYGYVGHANPLACDVGGEAVFPFTEASTPTDQAWVIGVYFASEADATAFTAGYPGDAWGPQAITTTCVAGPDPVTGQVRSQGRG